MEQNILHGLKISRLTLGTVQLGLNYGINNIAGQPSTEEGKNILKAALSGGVNTLDTSSDYGKSEDIIGSFLSETGEKMTVVTKFDIGLSDFASQTEIDTKVFSQVENSLRRLKFKKLPLLLLHSDSEYSKHGKKVDDVLIRLKSQGLIERAGISMGADDENINIITKNDLYEAVQIPLNLFDTARIFRGTLDLLQKSDKIVFARIIFLQGLFFKNPENLPDGLLQNAAEPLKKIKLIAEKENIGISELAISFVKYTPGISSLILGVETVGQIEENLKLFATKQISDESREEILNIYNTINKDVLMPWKW